MIIFVLYLEQRSGRKKRVVPVFPPIECFIEFRYSETIPNEFFTPSISVFFSLAVLSLFENVASEIAVAFYAAV